MRTFRKIACSPLNVEGDLIKLLCLMSNNDITDMNEAHTATVRTHVIPGAKALADLLLWGAKGSSGWKTRHEIIKKIILNNAFAGSGLFEDDKIPAVKAKLSDVRLHQRDDVSVSSLSLLYCQQDEKAANAVQRLEKKVQYGHYIVR